jgi:hypothetical protein
MGVPVHPLLIHAAVVLVPLLALLAIAYALVPFIRAHIRLVLGLLALVTPISTLLAKLSGDAFFRRLQERNMVSPEYFPKLERHQSFGTMTLYSTIALAVVTLGLVLTVGPKRSAASRAMSVGLAVLSVAAAGVSLYYVIRTGDSGAKAVWTGV